MDIKSPEERSKNMSKIKDRCTKPELFIRKLLFKNGFRYRINYCGIFGKPDIYIPKKKTAVFVHGCFWHRHNGCKFAYIPKSNTEFWDKKFSDNINRDNIVKQTLLSKGIRLLLIWECTVKKMKSDINIYSEIEKSILDFILIPKNPIVEI